MFSEICTNSSQDALNKAAFKRIGYSLNIGYLYNDDYGAVVNYYDQEIFSKEILDLNEYDRRLLVLPSFESALYKKRMELEYIEVAPKVYMTLSELERIYGLSLMMYMNYKNGFVNARINILMHIVFGKT